MNWIGDAAAHDTGDFVEIGFGMETITCFQLVLGFRAQRHQLQDINDVAIITAIPPTPSWHPAHR